jgi:hypothetical protein
VPGDDLTEKGALGENRPIDPPVVVAGPEYDHTVGLLAADEP